MLLQIPGIGRFFSLPRSLIWTILIFIIFQLFIFGNNNHSSINNSFKSYIGLEDDNSDGKQVYINDDKFISPPYKDLIKEYGNNFVNRPHYEKCELYFKNLYKKDRAWMNKPFNDLAFHRNIVERQSQYVRNKINDYKRDKLGDIESDEEKNKIVEERNLEVLYGQEWSQLVEDNQKTEDTLAGSMTNIRVFGSCFLDQYERFNKPSKNDLSKESNNCLDIETRLFPWISKILPVFKRWDGTITNGFPKMSEYINQSGLKKNKQQTNSGECNIKSFRDSFNGKRIVISAADKHTDDLIKLMGNLRSIGNKLPIEIVHSGDFDDKHQKKIIHAARNLKNLDLSHIDNLEDILATKKIILPDPEIFPEEYEDILEELFPPQELWFVDATGVISPDYQRFFSGYANKLIAFYFNSFRDTILMDIDAGLFVNIEEYILNSEKYVENGAYFFRDRALLPMNSYADINTSKKMLPTGLDKIMFGIPESTSHTLDNRQIGGRFKDYMESGIVAIDRVKHFTGILGIIQILFWRQITVQFWGDKELFWLGLSMAGDEDYYMNGWAAGAAGYLTPRNQRLPEDETDERRDKLRSNEIRSQHPAHISPVDNRTLLWINSGMSYCKFDSYAKSDYETVPVSKLLASSPEELETYYRSYHKIDSVIIPKPQNHFIQNDRGEPKRGWAMVEGCHGFLYCAYDKVGGSDDPDSQGYLIHYDQDTQKWFRYHESINLNSAKVFSADYKA